MKRDFVENNGFSFLMKSFTECAKDDDPQNGQEKQLKYKTVSKMVSLLEDLIRYEKFMNKKIDFIENET